MSNSTQASVSDRGVIAVIGPNPRSTFQRGELRVRCDALGAPLAPLERLRRRIDGDEPISTRVIDGLRARLLGEPSHRDVVGELVASLNRFALREVNASVVFDRVDRADSATLDAIRSIVRRRGWLRLPLVVTVTRRPEPGPVADLLTDIKELYGSDAIVNEAPTPTPQRESPVAITSLPAECRHVLRALAIAAGPVPVAVLGDLVRMGPVEVLEALQLAVDAGVPVEDGGEGIVALPEGVTAAIAKDLLPSLRQAYHRRLAQLWSERSPQREEHGEPQRAPARAAAETDDSSAPAPSPAAAPSSDDTDFELRAAEHAEAAGELELAIEHYLGAARRAEADGAVDDALTMATRALALSESLAPTAAAHNHRGRALTALGALHWRNSGMAGMSLPRARELLERATAAAEQSGDVATEASARSVLAGVCYDIGGDDDLALALRELARAHDLLSQAGRGADAARLLNDQAAIWVRLGELEKATALLGTSQRFFAERANDSAIARLELAETEHLLARLILHIPDTARLPDTAMKASLSHAANAETLYETLGLDREAARVWETQARLLALTNEWDRAAQKLLDAAAVQHQIADAVGLARTTAALADVLLRVGRVTPALQALADSISLNTDTGSRIGLRFNRDGLDALRQGLGADAKAAHAQSIAALDRELARAEALFAR